jgi:tungstate transport system ATP-binding protein
VAETFLTLRDVVVRYGEHTALRVDDLDIESGEVVAIIGPNGSGKSTLLRVIGFLQRPTQGSVRFCGDNGPTRNSLELRRRIATVFQEPLLLNASVYQNAALGLKLRGMDAEGIKRRLTPWLERLGIAHLGAQSARTLSGGEAQRTSLARAFALSPELLLLDEPFAALDPATRATLLADFQHILRESGVTTVFVTHDRNEAFALGERVGVLIEGRIAQLGPREEIFHRPQSDSIAEIVGFENRLPGVVDESDGALVTVRIKDRHVRAGGRFQAGAKVLLCIRAENVSIAHYTDEFRGLPQLKAKIVSIASGLLRDRMTLDCGGFEITASADRKKQFDRSFCEGDEVHAALDVASIHLIGLTAP